MSVMKRRNGSGVTKERNGYDMGKKKSSAYGLTKKRVLSRINECDDGCERLRPIFDRVHSTAGVSNMSAEQYVYIKLAGIYALWLMAARNGTEFAARNSCLLEIAADVVSRLPDGVAVKIPRVCDRTPEAVKNAMAEAVAVRGLTGRQGNGSFAGVRWAPLISRTAVTRVRFSEACEGCGHEGTFTYLKKPTRYSDGSATYIGQCSNCGLPFVVNELVYDMTFDEYKAGLKSGEIN